MTLKVLIDCDTDGCTAAAPVIGVHGGPENTGLDWDVYSPPPGEQKLSGWVDDMFEAPEGWSVLDGKILCPEHAPAS